MTTGELIGMFLSRGDLPVRLLDGRTGTAFACTAAGVLRVLTKRGEANEEVNVRAWDLLEEAGVLVQQPPKGLELT